MTVTVQQLQEKIQSLPADAQINIKGTSGEEYPVVDIITGVQNLFLQVQDQVDDDSNDGDEDEDDGDEDEE